VGVWVYGGVVLGTRIGVGSGEMEVRNSKPEILNWGPLHSTPYTAHRQLYILNPQPSTLNPRPSTLNTE